MSPTMLRAQRGMTLIEVMVAMLLSILVVWGLVEVMTSVSRSSRFIQGGARIQENARFALSEIAQVARSANEHACLTFTGVVGEQGANSSATSESRRSLQVMFDATGSPWYLGVGPVTRPYVLDAPAFLRGMECAVDGDCATSDQPHPLLAESIVPRVGTAVGERLPGTDVLLVRGFRDDGELIVGQQDHEFDSRPARITLRDEASAAKFADRDIVVVSDCASSFVARVRKDGTDLVLANNFDDDAMPALSVGAQARVMPLRSGMDTRIYYVGVQQGSNASEGLPTSVLYRFDGDRRIPLAEGVDRFDIFYRAEDIDGRVSMLRASDVDDYARCWHTSDAPADLLERSGPCGWRSVTGIEAHLLVNSQDSVGTAADSAFWYPWEADGTLRDVGSLEVAAAGYGLPESARAPGLLRRHFSTFASIRSSVQ